MSYSLDIFELLPDIYHQNDSSGLLRTFLEAADQLFREVYDREQLVRNAQDIDACHQMFHEFIAQMLDWELESTTPEAQKFELRYVPELYDLKGTLLGISLYARLILGEHFLYVQQLFKDDPTEEFLHLVSGSGIRRRTVVFPVAPGFPQWSARHRKFSHVIQAAAGPENYTFGTWRPKEQKLQQRMLFMKAARSTSYHYYTYAEFNDLSGEEPYGRHRAKAFQSMSDLTGVYYLGQRSLGGWPLGRYAPPVHPELTGVFVDRVTPLGAKPLGGWRLGECTHEAHTVIQQR